MWLDTSDCTNSRASFICECWSGDTEKDLPKHFFRLRIENLTMESFERVEEIESIILIGKKGGVRRIILKDNPKNKSKGKSEFDKYWDSY